MKVKIVKAKLVMQIDEQLDDMSIEEIAEGMIPLHIYRSDTRLMGRTTRERT